MSQLSQSRRSFAQLAQAEGVNVATIWRWYFRGVRGCKLQTTVIGGRRFVTDEQWSDFVAALNGDSCPPPKATSRQREKAIAAAERELERAGI